MPALHTPEATIGWPAADFLLRGVDGRDYSLSNARGTNGLLVMFICNHCPFVQRQLDDIVRDTAELAKHGIGSIGIMSNDTVNYPDDGFDSMQALAEKMSFPFPYVIDPTQEVAQAYGAVCTPDYFGFDKDLKLRYRGRLGDYSANARPERELYHAMLAIAQGDALGGSQQPSIGCSIKWREAA